MAKEATHTSGVGIPKSALMDAARRYGTASLAAKSLGIDSSSFRRACNAKGVEWRNEKGWSNFTSRKYLDTCATKECDHKPSSNSGLCFKCYALLRAKE